MTRALVAAALLACFLPACTDGDAKAARPHRPVVLVGFDGMEWSVAGPLVRAGTMPNLRALIERGSAGYLYTERPALSPVCWTSIATGKRHRDHGIVDFIDARTKTPFTSNARATKALWNIASDYGLKTLCVGWWCTWPAEEIDGWMVAPYSAAGQNDQNWKGNMQKGLPDQTWPRALFDELWPIAEALGSRAEVDALSRAYFDEAGADAWTDQERTLVAQARWSVVADETYLRTLMHLQDKPDVKPDLTLCYFGCTDVVSHRFWRYMDPAPFRYDVPAESRAALQRTIERSYARADAMLGEALRRAPADANVIVCSDHGFHADFLDGHPVGLSGHHLDGPPGVIVVAGPDFVAGFGRDAILAGQPPPDAGFIYDVAPVVLDLLGIPPGLDFEQPNGGPLFKNVVARAKEGGRIEGQIRTHDEGFRPATRPQAVSQEATDQFKEWMRQNGYLGTGGENGDERTRPPQR